MKVILYIIVVPILFALYVRYLEKMSVFVPEKNIFSVPKEIGLNFEDVYFDTSDGVKLNGWFVGAKDAKSTLLFFHGNAGNIGDRLGKIALFHKLGLNVFIFDYRGYGKSEGSPTEEGIYKDGLAAFDYLVTRNDVYKNRIIGYGASLGSAVAVDLATKRPLAALILDGTFSSATDMAKWIYPFIPSFLIQTKLDSVSKIKNIAIPQLFIHSMDDEVVPIQLGQRLYEEANEPKEFLEICGNHNDGHLNDLDKFSNGIAQFLTRL